MFIKLPFNNYILLIKVLREHRGFIFITQVIHIHFREIPENITKQKKKH